MDRRIPLCVMIIVALISFSPQSESNRALSASSCSEKIAPHWAAPYFGLIEHHSLQVKGKGMTDVWVMNRKPFMYIVCGGDTFHNRKCHDVSQWPESEDDVYHSTKVYTSESLQNFFPENSNIDPGERILVMVPGEERTFVGSAIIKSVQLDEDVPTERIVHVTDNMWLEHFMIYDSAATGWKYLGLISLWDQGGNDEVDLSLKGYFGFETWYHACCLNVIDMAFYKIDHDTLRECFTINKSTGLPRFSLSGDKWISMMSESKVKALQNKINVRYSVTLGYESYGEIPGEGTIDVSDFQYNLIETTDHRFEPDRVIPKSYSELHVDTTYFFPENYAMNRLRTLQSNGSTWQKNLLAKFEYDSTGYYR